uniref:Uncharacterized protein n=1 Tax=Rhizophora mucronata TaxID=61149 RepID=A0A2P2IHF9_RHIMU
MEISQQTSKCNLHKFMQFRHSHTVRAHILIMKLNFSYYVHVFMKYYCCIHLNLTPNPVQFPPVLLPSYLQSMLI